VSFLKISLSFSNGLSEGLYRTNYVFGQAAVRRGWFQGRGEKAAVRYGLGRRMVFFHYRGGM
jgi:hypothetical protein